MTTWMVATSGWMVASLISAVWIGKAIHRADEADALYRQRLDEVERRRRERMRRAIEEGR